MKLSILMLGLANRDVSRMLNKLDKQCIGQVEILSLVDNKRSTVSDKRNQLISICKGEYVTFVDDDDDISDNYISSLLKGIEQGTDVVNFKVGISIDGSEYKDVLYSKDYKNEEIDGIYYRKPNHIMCIKKELSQRFPYRNVPGEDTEFADRIQSSIETEYNIDETLYYYNFSSTGSECQGTEHYNPNRGK